MGRTSGSMTFFTTRRIPGGYHPSVNVTCSALDVERMCCTFEKACDLNTTVSDRGAITGENAMISGVFQLRSLGLWNRRIKNFELHF